MSGLACLFSMLARGEGGAAPSEGEGLCCCYEFMGDNEICPLHGHYFREHENDLQNRDAGQGRRETGDGDRLRRTGR